MSQNSITTSEFGKMNLDSSGQFYETEIDVPYLNSKTISISAENIDIGTKIMKQFLSWFNLHHHTFKLPLEQEIQNYDLVWDEVWDSILGNDWVDANDGFLSDYLKYEYINFFEGKIHLWVNTSGLHSDHLVNVTINEEMQIECCEI